MQARLMRTVALPLTLSLVFSCGREHYRDHADEEAYGLLAISTSDTPWEVPDSFSIEPPPGSRLHDDGDPVDPGLPDPGPHLRAYEIPELNRLIAPSPERVPPGDDADGEAGGLQVAGLPVQPIPATYWDALPRGCLARMVEFASVRAEYEKQYGSPPGVELLDSSRRLSFAEIIALSVLDSRELQAQKERLYQSSLAVALERFDYSTRFSASGNGADVDYTNRRTDGDAVQSADVGTGARIERMFATGSTLLATFANDIVLTFDGPDGWATDVSSRLIVGLEDSLLQRDVRLESLVQTERNLVYAARDYARFRREFFVDLASRYYELLRTFRSIEIESQNYFSLVRTYEQATAEEIRGVKNAPNPVAIDQYEQSTLSGRSSLVSTWNSLERSLDALKLSIGLPTETPINIDLGELDELTLRDEVAVAAERVRRWRDLVIARRSRTIPDRPDVLSGDIFLIDRLLEWLRLRRRLGEKTSGSQDLEDRLLRFQERAMRDEVRRDRRERTRAFDPTGGAPQILRYGRTRDLIIVLLELIELQLQLATRLERDEAAITAAKDRRDALLERVDAQSAQLDAVLQDDQQQGFDELLEAANGLLGEVEELVTSLDTIVADDPEPAEEDARLAQTLERTDALVVLTARMLESAGAGLAEIEIDEDAAMMTALVQRFDLMNERGRLADVWRGIKLAADELRTAINFDSSYTLPTEPDKPFKFDDDNGSGQATISVDLPLNRRRKRNEFRNSLISYQSARRSLMQLEDSIKRDVRDALRGLAERVIQYPIGVTQAALAAEQVISVKLQLALGIEGVRGTDLLDAQEASRRALISVANDRIGYIVDRARLALDFERLQLDENDMWPSINDVSYQPTASLDYPVNAGPTYGDLPPGLFLSGDIRRLLDQPLPGTEAADVAGNGVGD